MAALPEMAVMVHTQSRAAPDTSQPGIEALHAQSRPDFLLLGPNVRHALHTAGPRGDKIRPHPQEPQPLCLPQGFIPQAVPRQPRHRAKCLEEKKIGLIGLPSGFNVSTFRNEMNIIDYSSIVIPASTIG